MPFAVLFVCTGNICRSPMAAALFRARVGSQFSDQVRVSSAGTYGLVGRPIDGVAAAALRELGVDADGHRAERIDGAMIDGADLVLTATVEHRRGVLAEDPRAFRRTFTLREFARLGAGLGPVRPGPAGSRWVTRVAEVAAQRGLRDPAGPGQDDIGDPFGAPLPVMHSCALAIDEAVRGVVRTLGLEGREPVSPLPRPS